MLYSLELLQADIQDELHKLERLEMEFAVSAEQFLERRDDVSLYDRSAIGYYLHSFYNGCENVFRAIARFFENDIGPQSWHADLLKRMKLRIEGYRPAVIDEELYLLLDDFRGFRHKFRHAYSFELDWERERIVAKKFYRAAELFRRQILAFLERLASIEDEK